MANTVLKARYRAIKKILLKTGYRAIKKILKKFDRTACGLMRALDKDRQYFALDSGDYVRASSLELIANEIYDKKIDGSVAELGVYRGDFAKIINEAFHDRKLYLFDTFEGFDERDVKLELKNNYSTGEQDFSKTSVELVLNKMKHKKNCIVRKGYFPETIYGEGGNDLTNERYAFVSIDVDLYEPMYKGLNYFYEKLTCE
ncbi:hypothetical protein FACS189491_00920 [Spirochaetia bacterium]|nr:hypothetical protein FACS189491_00920 [Spirochaetia bacterium]